MFRKCLNLKKKVFLKYIISVKYQTNLENYNILNEYYVSKL